MISAAANIFRHLASLKVAIPLIVLTALVTVIGSLQPDTDYYRTWWYLSLLGLNGLSLLFITILHIPSILVKKGRNALIGVVITHLGILLLIAGAIYGGISSFRYEAKVIEGEMTVVPGLPFVIRLDRLDIEDYPQDVIATMNPAGLLKKKQDSHVSLFKSGQLWKSFIARPGTPAKVDGITILPALNDIGWYFELIVTDPQGVEKTIPVKPWSPPVISLGGTQVMAHSLMDTGEPGVQILTLENGQMTLLGLINRNRPMDLNGSMIALGHVRRYTGFFIYNRPQAPVLVLGCMAILFGLVWHFYFRHRDRNRATKGDGQYV